MRGQQMLKNFFLSEKKLLKCNFKSKAQVHEKCFFLMKWNSFFAMQKTDFHELSFLQEKSTFRSLNAQNHFFRASKNTNSVV